MIAHYYLCACSYRRYSLYHVEKAVCLSSLLSIINIPSFLGLGLIQFQLLHRFACFIHLGWVGLVELAVNRYY
ncbi:uncharacterized protein BDV17DRAFT_182202 [Aspergillus undulatus]|uniref:uncharacterized protein n=1 Tax=Aspergillus undulatus TaxID=1810928 RepID=UPI003CCCA392